MTPSKNIVFDTERNEKHHADKFWALALDLSAISGAAKSTWDDMRDLGQLDDFISPFA